MGIKKIKNLKLKIKNFKGFTFIEMIVVIGVIGLALPVLFAIIFAILQQQTKIYRLSQVKREGDYALNVMENIIRNYAVSVHNATPPSDNNKVCSNTVNSYYSNSTSPYFLDEYGNYFRFNFSSNKIASESSISSAGGDLTTTKVLIQNPSIRCDRTATYSPPIVSISFTIQYNTTSTRPEEIATLNYQTKVKLRSY